MKAARSKSSAAHYSMTEQYSKFLDIVFVLLLVGMIAAMTKLIMFPIDQDIYAFVFGVFAILYFAIRLSGKSTK